MKEETVDDSPKSSGTCVKEVPDRLRERGRLKVVSTELRERLAERAIKRNLRSINLDGQILEEVVDIEVIKKLVETRKVAYEERGVAEPGLDPFDYNARFFILKNEGGEVRKVVRAVNRSIYGIIPTELNLLPPDEIKDFFRRTGFELFEDLIESTIDESGRSGIRSVLKKYEGSRTVYEVGGLYAFEHDVSDLLPLIVGIGQIAYSENWDLVVQTQRTTHAAFYMSFYPYYPIAGEIKLTDSGDVEYHEFLDCYNRPAITMALEGSKFREVFQRRVELWFQVRESLGESGDSGE